MNKEVEELLSFLHDKNPQVRQIALENALGYTAPTVAYREVLWSQNDYRPVKDLALLCMDQPTIAHSALKAMINLTTSAVFVRQLANDTFISFLASMIIDKDALLADPACMLLSNLTKLDDCAARLLQLQLVNPGSGNARNEKAQTAAFPALLDVFAKGADKLYNKHANYDFLATVFANVSSLPQGRVSFVSKGESAEYPIEKILPFTEHPNVIRRGGVLSTIKHVCFLKESHPLLLGGAGDDLGVLTALMLPLTGAEELDLEHLDALPAGLQLLPDDKLRERDVNLRLITAEALLLLCTTALGRRTMRERNLYAILRIAHQVEQDERIHEVIEQIVNLIQRNESAQTMRDGDPELSKALASAGIDAGLDRAEAPEVDEAEDDEELIIEAL